MARRTKKNDDDNKQIKFNFDRETKGTFRYAEATDDPIIGTLYIRKNKAEDYFGKSKPSQNLVLTIEEA